VALYLLDTNVFAALSQPKPPRAVERAFAKHAGELVIASVVLHEMGFGIESVPERCPERLGPRRLNGCTSPSQSHGAPESTEEHSRDPEHERNVGHEIRKAHER